MSTIRNWECETPGEKNVSVAGKMQKHYDYWEGELEASPFVLSMIKHGYRLPFSSTPPSFAAKTMLPAYVTKVSKVSKSWLMLHTVVIP